MQVPQPDADPRAFPLLLLSQQALLALPALLPPLVEAVADARTRRTTYLGASAKTAEIARIGLTLLLSRARARKHP